MVDLVVSHPPGLEGERRYACDVVLRDWLGLDYEIEVAERTDVRITASGDPSDRALHLGDVFFPRAAKAWLEPASLPTLPFEIWPAGGVAQAHPSPVPVLFGDVASMGSDGAPNGHRVRLPIDVFGSIFFLLTRYEELVSQARDDGDRFPASASLSHRFGLLNRPLANEYLEILWASLQRLWPGLRRRSRAYEVDLSHDVDAPFAVLGQSWSTILRSAAVDAVRRRAPDLAIRRLRAKSAGCAEAPQLDPNNTFAFIAATSERHGLQSTFFLMAGVSDPRFDSPYSLEEPPFAPLLSEIHARGHQLGLHPSYHTYRDGVRLKSEFDNLLRAAERLGIRQAAWGGRQHYLRFATPVTWRLYASVGLAYDATLSYADQPGFRCGTCYDFPVYDLEERQGLPLRERPLTVMEYTLLGDEYLRLAPAAARERITSLAAACRRFAGTFSLLWHNNHLITRAQQRLYETIVAEIAG
jgi:peptidoglycan/xylan/chitin deacetylase (PgdA/CDA1 family)